MATVKHYPFPDGIIEHVCKIIAELYSGSELTRIISSIPLPADPGEGNTKWRRLATAVSSNQAKTQTGNALIALVREAMHPTRTLGRAEAAQTTRNELNQALSLVSLKVREDGQIARTRRAHTVSEAEARTEQLRTMLQNRGAHPEAVAYCRPELLRDDFYEAVFEAIKGLASRLRAMSGVDGDGYKLVDGALGGKVPRVRLNDLQNQTQRDEQIGFANLTKGMFSAFRNPVAHEPRIEWALSEQDALDVLGTLSMLHRRLDSATVDGQ